MEKGNNTYLVADTSGLISLAVKTDRNHQAALNAAMQLEGRRSGILVPYEVLVETVNVLGKRKGHEAAATVAAYLEHTPLFLIADTPKQARIAAMERFKKQPAAVSFTDCIVMAVADQNATRSIFGFDADHQRCGYTILEKNLSEAA